MFANFKYIQYVVGKAHNMHIMSPWEVWQTTTIHHRIPHLFNKILFKRSWRDGEKIWKKIFTIYVFVHNINICPHKAKSQSCLKRSQYHICSFNFFADHLLCEEFTNRSFLLYLARWKNIWLCDYFDLKEIKFHICSQLLKKRFN